jgi:hypothetical protein
MLKCTDVFSIGEAWAQGGSLRARVKGSVADDFALERGDYLPAEPVEFVQDEGHEPRDLVGTTHATLTLVSPRFLGILRDHGCSGWATFPAVLALDDGTVLGGYQGWR